MAALPDLITVAQYRQIPPAGDKIYELHHGEVVVVSRPKAWHWLMQKRLEKLLEARLEAFVVGIEFPFRAIPEFDVRAGDVVAVRRERFAAMDHEDNLRGAPDLVVEVKSPSNRQRELLEKASLCLTNGTIEFWVVDRDAKSITAIQRDGSRQTFVEGESLPLTAFGGNSLDVAEIFA